MPPIYRRTGGPPNGLQRVVRGLLRRPLVDVRCAQQPIADWTRADGDRAGCRRSIGVPVVLPMDFSAWFEAYLGGRWWTFDARNNQSRIGRVLMATGRDAADLSAYRWSSQWTSARGSRPT